MTEPKPAVRVILHELLRVLEGNALTITDTTGRQVELRLFTADEFLVAQHAAVGNDGAKIDLARARDLTQPIRVTSAKTIRDAS